MALSYIYESAFLILYIRIKISKINDKIYTN